MQVVRTYREVHMYVAGHILESHQLGKCVLLRRVVYEGNLVKGL